MKNRQILILAIIIIVVYMFFKQNETYVYEASEHDYKYGFIDTNPQRRVSDAFDSADHSGGNGQT